MTKAGLNSMVRAFSRRVFQKGIRVNAIAPGLTLSEMTQDYGKSADGDLSMNNTAGRIFCPKKWQKSLASTERCKQMHIYEIIHTNAGHHLKPHFKE